jgi:hypothetical protein
VRWMLDQCGADRAGPVEFSHFSGNTFRRSSRLYSPEHTRREAHFLSRGGHTFTTLTGRDVVPCSGVGFQHRHRWPSEYKSWVSVGTSSEERVDTSRA